MNQASGGRRISLTLRLDHRTQMWRAVDKPDMCKPSDFDRPVVE
jgi:hypothetical protein